MAITINVHGHTNVYVSDGIAGQSWQHLGFAADTITITQQAFYHDVPGDYNGGPQGPPIDVQLMGSIVKVRLELSKWDEAVAAILHGRGSASVNAGVTHAQSDIGGLMFQNGGGMGLKIVNAAGTGYKWTYGFFREASEFNVGTKYSTLSCEFEAHRHPTTGVVQVGGTV